MAKKQRIDADDSPQKVAERPLPPPSARAGILRPPAETQYEDELRALAQADRDPRPPGWKLSPRSVRSFLCGGERPAIARKFFGDDAMVERAIVSLSSNRGLMLVGEPGTAKSMLSELLAAAISGSSINAIQGTAGTTEDHIKYSWNYALLLAEGPSPRALVASPLFVAMRDGLLVRFEEITRCPPEIQDTLVSVLSEKVMIVPELDGPDRVLHARPGFNVIGTANTRDRGVHEMSSALKRRFNFETIHPIKELRQEVELVGRECDRLLREAAAPISVRPEVVELLVSVFQDLRQGVTREGIQVERPSTVMSTAEAVSVGMAAGLDSYYFDGGVVAPRHIARHIAGAVLKDNPDDLKKLKHYFDVVVKQRSQKEGGLWAEMLEARRSLPLIPGFDPNARIVYAPVRHHSPACAWHVNRLIRTLRPDAVLIEGPRDATPLIPLLTHPQTRMPVAIYTTYIEHGPQAARQPDDGRHKDLLRHAAYYPLCDYSPELAAIRAAAELGARARFIDLTFPEMVQNGRRPDGGRALSLFEERRFFHSTLLQETCRRVGARDPDDLWDQLYELDYERREPACFFGDVLAYCALARLDYTSEMLELDGCAAREAAMAAAVAEEPGRIVVVTGGYHTVALPDIAPALPAPLRLAPGDALVTLMRYGFEQLDRLNGYASGMPAPEFYQRMWEGKPVSGLIVDLGREARKRGLGVSIADEIAALEQVRRLSALRGHLRPSREDVADGIRSVFIKGADDVEGLPILALARKLSAGERVGSLPPEAGVPPWWKTSGAPP